MLKYEIFKGGHLKKTILSFSLSGIIRTGSMGLISARFIQAPLLISETKLSEKRLKKGSQPQKIIL